MALTELLYVIPPHLSINTATIATKINTNAASITHYISFFKQYIIQMCIIILPLLYYCLLINSIAVLHVLHMYTSYVHIHI